jgi:hypothetical protein
MKHLLTILAVLALTAGAGAANHYCNFQAATNGNGTFGSPWNNYDTLRKYGTGAGVIDSLCGLCTLSVQKYWDYGSATWHQWVGQPQAEICAGANTNGIINIQKRLIIHDINFATSVARSHDNAILLASTDSCEVYNCTYHDFQGEFFYTKYRYAIAKYNTITTGDGHGFNMSGAHDVCDYNSFINIGMGTSLSNPGQSDCIIISGVDATHKADSAEAIGNYCLANTIKSNILIAAGISYGLTGITVTNNFCDGHNTVSMIDVDMSTNTVGLTNTLIANNTFVGGHKLARDASYAQIRFTSCRGTVALPNKLYNNTFYMNGNSKDSSNFGEAICIYGSGTNGHSNGYLDIKNNIVRLTDQNDSIVCLAINNILDTSANITSNYNLFYSTSTKFNHAVHTGAFTFCANDDTTHDPTFISTTNLGVYTSSPAYNTGTDLSSFFTTAILDSPTAAMWPNPATVTRVTWSKGAMYPYVLTAFSRIDSMFLDLISSGDSITIDSAIFTQAYTINKPVQTHYAHFVTTSGLIINHPIYVRDSLVYDATCGLTSQTGSKVWSIPTYTLVVKLNTLTTTPTVHNRSKIRWR